MISIKSKQPSHTYRYKGHSIYRYDLGRHDILLVPVDSELPSWDIGLSWLERFRKVDIEGKVEDAITELHGEIDDLIVMENAENIKHQQQKNEVKKV